MICSACPCLLESSYQILSITLRLRALRQALVGKALSASTNISSQKKCRPKFKKMLVPLLHDDVSQINTDDKEYC